GRTMISTCRKFPDPDFGCITGPRWQGGELRPPSEIVTTAIVHRGFAFPNVCCTEIVDGGPVLPGLFTVWETASGKERFRWETTDVPFGRRKMALSPDGRTLAGAIDNAIRLWDVRTGLELGQLRGHSAWINCLAFTADGRKLVSGSYDTTALVWDLSHIVKPAPAKKIDLDGKQLDILWNQLAGDDAGKAFEAITAMSAGAAPAVAWLRGRIKPGGAIDEKRLAGWIADLDSPQFTVRQQASAELEKIGDEAEPALKKALAVRPPLETRQRIEK